MSVAQPASVVGDELEVARRCVIDFLDAVGVDTSQPDVADAAARFTRLYKSLLTPEPFPVTTFENDAGYEELVLVRDIRFVSVCRCHLFPCAGVAHVGYLPGPAIIGLSKLARMVEHAARELHAPERLAVRTADWLEAELAPLGAGVMVETQLSCAGEGTRQVASVLRGRLRDDEAARQEFLLLSAPSGRTP